MLGPIKLANSAILKAKRLFQVRTVSGHVY